MELELFTWTDCDGVTHKTLKPVADKELHDGEE